MCCCLLCYNSSPGYAASACHMPSVRSPVPLLISFCLYSFLFSLTPSFFLYLALLCSLFLSPQIYGESKSLRIGFWSWHWVLCQKVQGRASAGLAQWLLGARRWRARLICTTRHCQSQTKEEHYKAEATPASILPALWENHIVLPRGMGVRNPCEQSERQLSPCRRWVSGVFHGRLHRKLAGAPSHQSILHTSWAQQRPTPKLTSVALLPQI